MVTMMILLMADTTSSSLTGSSSSVIPVIDSRGSILRPSLSGPTVALVSNEFSKEQEEGGSDAVNLLSSSENDESVSILTANGSSGASAAAIASVSGAIVLKGISMGDIESGLGDTRHAATLCSIFRACIQNLDKADEKKDDDNDKTALFLIIPENCLKDGDDDHDDYGTILEEVEAIFDGVAMEMDMDTKLTIKDLYNVIITSDDESKVMLLASSASSLSSKSTADISSAISNTYKAIGGNNSASSSLLSSSSESTPSVAAALFACDDSYSHQQRSARAKLSSWKSRVVRGFLVDSFGTEATKLLQRTINSYDRDTVASAGLLGSAAPYRLEIRSKLLDRIEVAIRELFELQIQVLEKNTLRKFNAELLRKYNSGSEGIGTSKFYQDNESAVRNAFFAFESSAKNLEVRTSSLTLTKDKACALITEKLNSDLLSFPDSPAAKLKSMKEVTKATSKKKEPTKRSVDLGLDLVAMIRPDGFGNFQGFAGYQLGGNNVIVGLHNDADSPDVISQFGGVRPPFLRVQPKLKVDVEL